MMVYITKIISNEVMRNKKFWKPLKSFLANKGIISKNEIFLFEGKKLVNN